MGFIAVYITNDSEIEAKRIADLLLNEKMIACANIFPINAQYLWKGNLQNGQEWVAIVKTTTANWGKLKSKIEKIHPYEVPCIMKFEVEANQAYEDWITKSVQ